MSDLLRMSAANGAPIVWLYFFCHFGDHLTQSFEDIGADLYSVTWYSLPVDMQKDWLMMIPIGQKNINLPGFGSTPCNRELFMKVQISIVFEFITVTLYWHQPMCLNFTDHEGCIFIFHRVARHEFLKRKITECCLLTSYTYFIFASIIQANNFRTTHVSNTIWQLLNNQRTFSESKEFNDSRHIPSNY